MVCLWSGNDLDELTDDVFDTFTAALVDTPSARPGATPVCTTRPGLQSPPGLLRAADLPPHPTQEPTACSHRRRDAPSPPQPEIRKVALRYLEVVATTLRPSTVLLRADSLIISVSTSRHTIPIYAGSSSSSGPTSKGSWCGTTPALARLARPRQAGGGVSFQTHGGRPARLLRGSGRVGVDRSPTRQLVFASDIPRLDRPMPKALPPDVDRDLMAAVAGLADPFARHGLAILRGTGMRLGELLDLELDCLWDFGDRGTWVKVPLGKLGTERTVPLDEPTLADFDAWMHNAGRNER